ncbi:MAG: YcxB family protein [Bacteroidales bacterium]|nr:YcxB family protein [Lachnoclostridium sp.]MCM1383792.1 YcxB family protein [Lachnoclostridium sp.]MCM1464420.1 YcxB family protein [Bacteroidales bacterium]
MVELDIKIEAADLYDYNLRHAYHSAAGLMGSILGALMAVVGIGSRQWIYLIGGAALLLYLPWTLFIKCKQQALANPAFQEPLHYVLDDEGISVSQGEAKDTQRWEDMVKAVSTSRSIIVYTSKANATIFPRKQMGEKTVGVIECISTHMPPAKVKIRW